MKNIEKERVKKLAFVRLKLSDTSKHALISVETGISLSTLNNVRKQKVKDLTIERLYVYLRWAND